MLFLLCLLWLSHFFQYESIGYYNLFLDREAPLTYLVKYLMHLECLKIRLSCLQKQGTDIDDPGISFKSKVLHIKIILWHSSYICDC